MWHIWWGNEKCVQGFGQEIWREETPGRGRYEINIKMNYEQVMWQSRSSHSGDYEFLDEASPCHIEKVTTVFQNFGQFLSDSTVSLPGR